MGVTRNPPRWFDGDPPITHIYLPVPDTTRPWGSSSCNTCKESTCAGHYNTILVDTSSKDSLKDVQIPPSAILKQKFMELKGGPVTDEFLEDAV